MAFNIDVDILPPFQSRPTVAGRRGVVASGHYMATEAGLKMLAKGGNAVDAGVAAGFALAVTRPHKNGIGGECPILIYTPKEGKVYSVSGVGTSPGALTIQWLKERGIKSIPGNGYLGAVVPAQIGAFCTALMQFGTLPLDVVLEPAIELCYEGYPLYEGLRQFLDASQKLFTKEWPTTGAVFLDNGRVPKTGSLVKQPDLGNTYAKLAEAYKINEDLGREAAIQKAVDRFYKGDIAKEILEFASSYPVKDASGKTHTGMLTPEDFEDYQTRIEEPLSVSYRNYRVFKCGPWTQGPVMLQMLKLLEGYDLKSMGHNSAQYVHTIIECMKLAYHDRNKYYGDPLFAEVPMDSLLSAEYAGRQRDRIDPYSANNACLWEEGPDHAGDTEDMDTTHLDIIDAQGFMMSATPSGGWICSSPRIPGTGIQLSTRAQMFCLEEGHPNALEPGKRPRATLTPSMAFKDGKPWMAFGTPGGDNQDQWALQLFLNVTEFGMGIQNAIDAPSFYSCHFANSFYPHEAHAGYIFHEPLPGPVAGDLLARGHRLFPLPSFSNGEICAVARNFETGLIEGGASPKEERQSYAMGW